MAESRILARLRRALVGGEWLKAESLRVCAETGGAQGGLLVSVDALAVVQSGLCSVLIGIGLVGAGEAGRWDGEHGPPLEVDLFRSVKIDPD